MTFWSPNLSPSQIDILLVETQGPINIGTIARTMASFDCDQLKLVAPQTTIDQQAYHWACHGKKVLENTTIYPTLDQAITPGSKVFALSRRIGKKRGYQHLTLPQFWDLFADSDPTQPYSFVFGSEESGLANQHLEHCHYTLEIPTHPQKGSLNLAHSVSILFYQLLSVPKDPHSAEPNPLQPLKPKQLTQIIEKATPLLRRVGYPNYNRSLTEELKKLERILARNQFEAWESNYLLGILKQVSWAMDHLDLRSQEASKEL